MSKLYIRLLAIAATAIALTGAYFSIAGLAKLFAGAAASVAFMAGALEFSKLVVTGFLYRYWGHIQKLMRAYLCIAVILLMGITSLGIYGYLTNAYQIASLGQRGQYLKIRSLEEENERVLAQAKEFRAFINSIPAHRISRRLEFQRDYEPKIRRLHKQSEGILAEVTSIKQGLLKTNVELGPLSALAEFFHCDADVVVRYLIFVFVCVFDPLAVCLIFCLNLAIRLREKYRGNEVLISAHSLDTPVDHRFARKNPFKKAA